MKCLKPLHNGIDKKIDWPSKRLSPHTRPAIGEDEGAVGGQDVAVGQPHVAIASSRLGGAV